MADSKTDSTVAFIRDELRDEISLSRKERRSGQINKSRRTLGEVTYNAGYSEEFVIECAKKLRKKPLSIKEYEQLQNALLQSQDHINAFFKISCSFDGLVRDLSSKSTHAKLGAVSCCCNLSLGNSKACGALCKFAAPYLLHELEGSNISITEACLWTIGNMASESEKAFKILHAQKCIKSLTNLAHRCSDELMPAVSYACLRYMRAGAGQIEVSDMTKLGDVVSTRYPKVSDVDTSWLLAVLSSTEECSNQILTCMPAVLSFIIKAVFNKDESIEKISAALRILCNTVSEPSGQVAHSLLNNSSEDTKAFFDKLLSHPSVHIQQETLWLIGNLCNHGLNSVQHTIKSLIFTVPSLSLAVKSFDPGV
ncbi:hypothetical protein QAD02_012340 [Eretmocerus hayati]|uniref:Uncharacterized protein n=1 Tax=Eretmocerus hayati TaxID=131215 RepID=A0ACC2NZB6_9HYME|nr:hypothetical protein QAD02_012340 [Eretmocerus hayati]